MRLFYVIHMIRFNDERRHRHGHFRAFFRSLFFRKIETKPFFFYTKARVSFKHSYILSFFLLLSIASGRPNLNRKGQSLPKCLMNLSVLPSTPLSPPPFQCHFNFICLTLSFLDWLNTSQHIYIYIFIGYVCNPGRIVFDRWFQLEGILFLYILLKEFGDWFEMEALWAIRQCGQSHLWMAILNGKKRREEEKKQQKQTIYWIDKNDVKSSI